MIYFVVDYNYQSMIYFVVVFKCKK